MYFKRISVLMEDVCIPMVVIFIIIHHIMYYTNYVNLFTLPLNFPNINVFYSSVEIFLCCCFQMKKNTYFATFLLLNFTTIYYKCSIHDQNTLGEINRCLEYQYIYVSEDKKKVYTKKELVFFEEYISNFHHEHDQPEIENCHLILPI